MFFDENMLVWTCAPKFDWFYSCFFKRIFPVHQQKRCIKSYVKMPKDESHELISGAIHFHHYIIGLRDNHQTTVSTHGLMIATTETFSLNIWDNWKNIIVLNFDDGLEFPHAVGFNKLEVKISHENHVRTMTHCFVVKIIVDRPEIAPQSWTIPFIPMNSCVESVAFHWCGNADACWKFPHWFMFKHCFNQLVWGSVTFGYPVVAGDMPWRILEIRRHVDDILVWLLRKNYGCS